MYKNKKVLVTGGTGLIGKPLVDMLIERGAKVRIASLDDPSRAHPGAEFFRVNLLHLSNCLKICEGMDYVFHLAGVKGSPVMTAKKPASFFVPIVTFNTNMMEAARQCGVERYLYTSSVGVYAPAEIFYEDDVWKTFPSEYDRFAGWAKRIGEMQAEAYKIEYGWDKISVVRPTNVYGPFDNFDPHNAMVIPSLIRRAVDGENPFVVWGDGSPVRDFIFSEDVARGMVLAVEKEIKDPVNLGCGEGVSIRELVEVIIGNLANKPEIVWDTSKPAGDKKRLADITRAKSFGFAPQVSLADGIRRTIEWYEKNRTTAGNRYNVFTEKHFA